VRTSGSARKRHPIVVAIDGPAGSGKTTVAKGVARALGLDRLDTGAMYRALTLKALREGIDPSNGRALAALARRTRFEHDKQGVLVDGRRPGRAIRTPEVNRSVSEVAAHPAVRKVLVERQRDIMERGGFVAEGRDIGTVVAPAADVKVYLTASVTERADRRHRELSKGGVRMTKGSLKKDQIRRDRRDSTRAASPLTRARDAHVIDSTGRTPANVVAEVVALAEEASRGRRRR
jgi:CMP/dCMP kinase